MMMTSGDFTLTGFSSDTAIANAANGTFTMSSGEVFGYGESDNGKAIISKALADFNGLKVGDESPRPSTRSISSPSCVAADRTIACDTPGMRSTIARCESKNGAMAMHGQ